jgi:hypothetical protein
MNLNFLKHIYAQPFVFTTGLAAGIHSTWALGTLFSGEQPALEAVTDWVGMVHFLGWIAPALLIAFAMDVGQIITSHEIRTQGMNVARGTTFFVFALFTYYLQWMYMAHHMPLVELAPGITDVHRDAALWLRNMGLWLIPALLPLSTLLYTFSSEKHIAVQHIEQPTITMMTPVEVAQPSAQPMLPQVEQPALPGTTSHLVTCPDCGRQFDKESAISAQRALAAHKPHCTGVQSPNGKHPIAETSTTE